MLATVQRKEASGLHWLKHCGSWFGFTEPAEFRTCVRDGGGFFATVASGDQLAAVAENGRTEPSNLPLCPTRCESGVSQREARTIGELPEADKAHGLCKATAEVARLCGLNPTGQIELERPVYEAFGLCRHEAMQHHRAAILGKLGAGLALGPWFHA